ncbi:unnamed protein product [Heterosigma akashiwo]
MSTEEPKTDVLTKLEILIKDSISFYKKCQKPDKKEYQKIALATGMGFVAMGALGCFVKMMLIFVYSITGLPTVYK